MSVVEVRFHGRGGQSYLAFPRLLGEAALLDGLYAQVYASFGTIRPGMPSYAGVRIDRAFIRTRSTNASLPDHVVVLDNSLLLVDDVTSGLRPGGTVLVGKGIGVAELKEKVGSDFKIHLLEVGEEVPALARQVAVLAEINRVIGLISPQALFQLVDSRVPAEERPACHAEIEKRISG